MNDAFTKNLVAIPVAEPDEIDRKLLAELDAEHDPNDEGTTLDSIIARREFSGKILLRVPRELHAQLIEIAKEQGVSLNQYCLYKLAR
ncbi:MAG: type II toxin-antitoxin system HicB family antitoxin [Oscillospiraceae bacterium]|nr:type II toxin-antitoxin system HicB family antitoxin [Oscillospiraceae bacterium]